VSEDSGDSSAETALISEQSESAIDPGLRSVIQAEIEKGIAGISEKMEGKFKAYNHEFGQLRRKLKKGQEVEQVPVDAQAGQLSREDVASLIRVGHLRSSSGLSSDALETISALELPPGKEEAILEAIASNQPVSKARDAREIKRGTTSAPRNSAQLPATQKEFLRLRHTDPKRFRELAADDGFDATTLPRV
tara:strand:- start:197 stop:772 length:576 start_codon:yes stop_codon:yes gene_type:complete